MRTLFIVVAALVLAACVSKPEPAKPVATTLPNSGCGSLEYQQAKLTGTFGEFVRWRGVITKPVPGMAELYQNDKTGSWTFAITLPTEVTCLQAVGIRGEAPEEDMKASDER